MKNTTLLLLSLFTCFSLLGQINYTFSTNTSVGFSYLSGGTTQFDNNDNDDISSNISIGFTFNYECNNYTQLQICTEGWLGLGGGLGQTSNNNLSGSSRRPVLAPLWDDIRLAKNVGAIKYRTTGTAPNRVFTVEWNKMRWDESAGGNNSGTISFQAILYETSNVIIFHYQNESASISSGASASIGISGTPTGSFYSVNVSSQTVSTVTETSNISTSPGTNRRYIFTPVTCSGSPTAGTVSPSASTVTCGSAAVNFTVAGSSSGCGITYQWQSSTNGTTWTNISGATNATYSQTVLSTTYFRRITSCTASGLSSNSNSVLVTFNTCTGIPNGGTSSTPAGGASCSGVTKTISLAGASTGCGISYQWQYSTDNNSWFDFNGQTGTSVTATVYGLTYFRCVVTCSNSGLSSNSTVTTVTSSGTPPSNDLPCNAIGLSFGAPSSGNNSCSGNTAEPSTPTCWTGGAVNTVWYSFVAPASGSVRIKTIIQASASVLQRTQMALYSGTCSNLTQIGCNINAPACGGYTPRNSEISATGLIPGNTYYVSVDGENSNVGDFAILVISGTGAFPYVPGQDCPITFSVCNPVTTIGNPGYQAIGGTCDHVGTNNCTNGEANSIWYTININPALAGTMPLELNIVPNDYGNPNPITGQFNGGYSNPGNESDYDFVIWKVGGTGATNCAGIAAGAAPVACNYSSLGVTGTSAGGTAPAPYTGFDNAYSTAPTAAANDVFVIVIQNWANSTSGFSLQFPAVTPVVYVPPTIVYWSGGSFTNSYTSSGNWGGCNSPNCAISAVVTSSSSNQPVLPAGTYGVRDLTINAGASLTLQTGATLQICGNFINNGSLICQPGSFVEMIGTGTQTLTGAFENNDSFFNFTVNKLTGSVVMANNIEVDGNFLMSNTTSVLNTGGLRLRVGGNFTNSNGNSTYTNSGTTGTLEFNGTGAQTYTQGNSQLDLNFVIMAKSGGDLTLNSNMFIKTGTGSLTLTNGKIITGANRVDVANGAPASVNAGGANSYIVGNLYRTLNGAAGSFDFPLGTSTNYERANVTFTTATTIPRLLTRFDAWAGAPNTIGLTECLGNYVLPAQNMGLWTLNASANPTSGTYNMTLYSTGATNTAGASGWTIQKAASAAGPWSFNGTCALSSVSVIQRTGMSGFSVFGVAQSTTPLPIELMDFTGYLYMDKNVLRWTTVSEINSDYFLLEKSRNGQDFELLEKLNAQGNSYTPIDYATVDETPFNGITYYRLKFYDLDGSFDKSKTIAVSSEISKDLKISSIFPNPGKDELNMEYSVSANTNLNLTITDAAGREIKNVNISIKGNGTYTVDTSNLAEGIYLFTVSDNEGFKEVYNWVKK